MSRIRPWVVLAMFVMLTLPLMPLQQLFLWFSPRMARAFPMHYHRLLCRLLGVKVEVFGRVPQHGPLLIASNHVSWLDIVVLSAIAPVSFVAKKEVAGWPLFGCLARLQRTVFVDRDRRHATGTSRNEMRERLAAGEAAHAAAHHGAHGKRGTVAALRACGGAVAALVHGGAGRRAAPATAPTVSYSRATPSRGGEGDADARGGSVRDDDDDDVEEAERGGGGGAAAAGDAWRGVTPLVLSRPDAAPVLLRQVDVGPAVEAVVALLAREGAGPEGDA